MKFTVSSSALYSHLQSISKVIAPKSVMPILEGFLFDIRDQSLSITASDSETVVETKMELIDSEQNIGFVVPAKSLMDSLKEISEQPIMFDINVQNLDTTVYYQNGKFNFMAASADEYPRPQEITESLGTLVITAGSLLKGINSTIFASADDDLRPVMNGVVMDVSAEDVTFVASDSHKLVRLKNTGFKGENLGDSGRFTLIVRKKPLQVLKGVLPKDESDVQLMFSSKRVVFRYDSYTMSSQLIEGRFPNYNAVIPTNNPFSIWVDRLSFLSAIKRVSLCSDLSNNLVKLEIKENAIRISAQNPDFSTSAEESVACDYADQPIVIGFKAIFLIDILSNLVTDSVVIKLADSSRAGLVMPSENPENEELIMLIMPMMIQA